MASFKFSFQSIRGMGMGFLCGSVLFWHLGQRTSLMTVPQQATLLSDTSMRDHKNDYYVPPLCESNPFVSALEPLPTISRKMDEWFLRLDELGAMSKEKNMTYQNHARFFPFDALTPCNNMTCVGGPCSGDTSKIVCGLDELNMNKKKKHRSHNEDEQRCIVYSIGGNNQWEFEQGMLERTTCEIHTFDCTGPIQRFQVPENHGGRLHFHHVCITDYPEKPRILENEQKKGEGANNWRKRKIGESWTLLEMQQKLGHKRIDLLKLDAEGYEFPLMSSWPELMYKESENILLPMQIVVEVHYIFNWKSATDILAFQAHLMRLGYVVTVRDNNPKCGFCVELTLIRARCPNTGMYATA